MVSELAWLATPVPVGLACEDTILGSQFAF